MQCMCEQDSVVLPLRKALFSGLEEARLVAVEGFLALLRLPQLCNNNNNNSSNNNNNNNSSSTNKGIQVHEDVMYAMTSMVLLYGVACIVMLPLIPRLSKVILQSDTCVR